MIAEQIKGKWQPVLEHPDLPAIDNPYKKNVTAVLLENQEQFLSEAPTNSGMAAGALGDNTHGAGGVQSFDPVLISLVRRSMPNLVAYDICGVQPMTGPTGLIFALKSNYVGSALEGRGGRQTEALFNEANVDYAGSSGLGGFTGPGGLTSGAVFNTVDGDPLTGIEGSKLTTAQSEALGGGAAGEAAFNEMAFSIERTSVVAKSRALKAEYTTELAQDLRAVHGLDAETELANILSTEILAEINREVVRTVLKVAKLGCQQTDLFYKNAVTGTGGFGGERTLGDGSDPRGGVYDILHDSDGRWSAERFRGLLFQIERECNRIAKDTRRGKGNMVICSSDVAAALAMSGSLQATPMGGGQLQVDDTGNTFVGTLGGGRLKVYVDPYAEVNYVCVGYKGTSQYDAGIFYCPYVPLQMVRAVGEGTFQPKIGFKTRYGMVSNPFVESSAGSADGESLTARKNQYYRIFRVDNLHGISGG
jgi:hypothetical protein